VLIEVFEHDPLVYSKIEAQFCEPLLGILFYPFGGAIEQKGVRIEKIFAHQTNN
jgi:hypothetical protein